MQEKEKKPFEFRTWGFEIEDILNIAISVFVIIRMAIVNGPAWVYPLRAVEIIESVCLILFIVFIWKNHEETKERRFFTLAFLVASVGVLVQSISAAIIVMESGLANPFPDILLMVLPLIFSVSLFPCFIISSIKPDNLKIWGNCLGIGAILIAVVSLINVAIFFVYKDLASFDLDDALEIVSLSLPLLLTVFALVEKKRWSKAISKEN